MNKIIKLFLCVIIFMISSKETFAQAPCDNNGEMTYQEVQDNIQTNHYGVISHQVGNGTLVSESFSELIWENNPYRPEWTSAYILNRNISLRNGSIDLYFKSYSRNYRWEVG